MTRFVTKSPRVAEQCDAQWAVFPIWDSESPKMKLREIKKQLTIYSPHIFPSHERKIELKELLFGIETVKPTEETEFEEDLYKCETRLDDLEVSNLHIQASLLDLVGTILPFSAPKKPRGVFRGKRDEPVTA
ncbi:hypothetical protein TNCV_1540381 [Trichonephila clavipes]|nr:hypothetical protein TNCV_1540381 [Trichonephila clavipes]